MYAKNKVLTFLELIKSNKVSGQLIGNKNRNLFNKSYNKASEGYIRPVIVLASLIARLKNVDAKLKTTAEDLLLDISNSDYLINNWSAKYELVKLYYSRNNDEMVRKLSKDLIEDGFFPVYQLFGESFEAEEYYDFHKAIYYYEKGYEKGHMDCGVRLAVLSHSKGNIKQKIQSVLSFIKLSFRLYWKSFKRPKKEYFLELYPHDYDPKHLSSKFSS